MVEKIGHIKNPLTIIAIFAGISEISSAAVFPFLEKDIQQIFVWFVIGFPASLIAAFFVTLNWNNKVLYAPSDYKEDNSFLKTIKMTTEEVKAKITGEINVTEENDRANIEAITTTQNQSERGKENQNRNIINHYLVEDMAIREFEKETKSKVERDVKVLTTTNAYLFDGMYVDNEVKTFIEIKYLRGIVSHEKYAARLRMEIFKAAPALEQFPNSKLIVIFVLSEPLMANDKQADWIYDVIRTSKINVSVKNYYEKDLKARYGVD